MDLVWIVLLTLLVIYIPIYIYVRSSEKAHEKGFLPYGPLIMIRTQWGLKMMDRLGKYKRFWNIFGLISVAVSFLLMFAIVSIVVIDMALLPKAINSTGLGIEYALAIPGLNPMLPLIYGIIGLVFAVVIHELAHGFQSRANDLRVDSSGILYGVIPIGAFVEPNEEDVEKASRKTKFHLYAAGITTNFITAAVIFMMIFASVGAVDCDYGDNPAVYAVTSDSEAYNINIPATAIILGIGDNEIDSVDSFYNSIDNKGELKSYKLTYLYKGSETVIDNIVLGAVVSNVTEGSPASTLLSKGDQILALSADGNEWTYIDIPSDFTTYMHSTEPNTTLHIKYGNPQTAETSEPMVGTVTLSKAKSGCGFLGISTTLSGMTFTTPNLVLNTGINPFYGDETVGDYAMSCISYISAPFQGFSPIPADTQWWFECTFMDSDIFWIIIQTLYWMFWLNLVLAVSNALPAIPFDGGYVFSYGVDYILEKSGMRDEEKRSNITNRVTSFMSYMMIFAMVLILLVIIV